MQTYLVHHGILGQKWGIRRFQNYDGTLINPKRDTKTISDRERRYFDKRNSFTSDEDKDLWEFQQNARNKKERESAINERARFAKESGIYDADFKKKSLSGKALDDAYKKFLRNQENFYDSDYKGVVKGESDDDLSYTNKKNAKPYKGEDAKEMQADVTAINGGMAGRDYGFNRNTNCGFCAVSYEMRRRGMPVRAQEGDGAMDPAIFNAFRHGKNDIKITAEREMLALHEGLSENEFVQMRDGILKDSKNSRGVITLCWKALARGQDNIGGHAISYEVKDGDFFVVDPQIGKLYKGNEAYQYLKHANKIQYMRTDNKKLESHAEQYFAESDATKIKTNVSKRLANVASIAAGVDVIGLYAGSAISALTGNPVPLAAALITSVTTIPVSAIASGVSEHQIKKHKDALMEKYRKEGRNTYYSTGKLDKAAKDNLGKSKSVKSKIQSLKGSHSISEIAKMLGMDPKTVKLYM